MKKYFERKKPLVVVDVVVADGGSDSSVWLLFPAVRAGTG
jgi:hypothetical protein